MPFAISINISPVQIAIVTKSASAVDDVSNSAIVIGHSGMKVQQKLVASTTEVPRTDSLYPVRTGMLYV